MKRHLLPWMREWNLSDNLLYKQAAEKQAIFVRDKVGLGLLECTPVFVVSTHKSKSVLLPVYYIKMRNGLELMMRDNFYDWKLSVKIPEGYTSLPLGYIPEDCICGGIGDDKENIPSCYLEGFPSDWSFPAYNPLKPGKSFTVEISNDYRLYVVLHALKYAYPNLTFNTDDDHRSLDELEASIKKIHEDNNQGDTDIWELLWKTYDSARNEAENYNLKDPHGFARCISESPAVHNVFLSEEYCYN